MPNEQLRDKSSEQDSGQRSNDGGKKNEEDKKQGNMNIFIAKTVYPDASSIFSFRVKPLQEIKDTCFVIPDTNALLLPYTATQESVDQIRKTYSQLRSKDRLRIPSQVAREFAKNRPNKLSELYQQLSKKRNSNFQVARSKYPLLESLDDYKKMLQIEQELSQSIENYRNTIGKLMEHIRGWSWNDPVSNIYADLFTSDIVFDPVHNENDVKKDLQVRNLHNIPPGYKDKSKEDDGVGDLLIWYAILELGKERDVIFVSGDTKPDWWYRSENQHLYPRYELIEEFRRASSGRTFHIISLSELLELYGAIDSIVEEVKQKEKLLTVEQFPEDIDFFASKKANIYMDSDIVEKTVILWAIKRFNATEIMIPTESEPYKLSFTENDRKVVVDIKHITNDLDPFPIFSEMLIQSDSLLFHNDIDKYIGVLVAVSKRAAMKIFTRIFPAASVLQIFVVGYIDSDGQFVSLTF